jgi:hypothetical protein
LLQLRMALLLVIMLLLRPRVVPMLRLRSRMLACIMLLLCLPSLWLSLGLL